MYRQQFGLHLFGDADFFPGTGKYTLAPLQNDGEASLRCDDVEGMEWVRLKEIHVYWGGTEGEIEVRKATGGDVFTAYAARGAAFPRGRLIKAVFEVKFADCKTPRSVTIKPSNIAQFRRDHDSVLIDAWLALRGFVIQREADADADAAAVLVSA